MAKQKWFHEKVVSKLRRDAGFAWTGGFIEDMRALVEGEAAREIRAEHPVIGERFIASLQQEAIIRVYDEDFRRKTGKGLDDPFIYPGLMAAWESAPVTAELDPGAFERALEADPDFNGVSADDVRSLFPACIMFDVRPFALKLHGTRADALFVYPSYDDDRGYEVLLAVAVGLKEGLCFPLESKLVMEGESLADMLVFSEDERERMRGRCMAGLDDGLHGEIFSPFEDEERVALLLVLLLGVMLWDGAEVEASEHRGVPHWRIGLAEPDGPESGGGAAAPEPADDPDETAVAAPVEHPKPLAPAESEAPEELEEPAAALADAPPVRDVGEELRLRDLLAAQESKSATLEYHLKQARAAADEAERAAAGVRQRAAVLESMDIPQTPAESLALAERAFPDRLAVLPAARKGAEEFRKGSAAEVWAVLRSIAVVLHPLVFGSAPGNIVYAFQDETGFELTLREMKMIKQSGQLARLRTAVYKGEERDASAHVKGKGSKRGEALRVHFFADYDERKIVIATCGEHLETFVTSSL